MVERIEKVGSRLVKAYEEDVILGIEGTVEIKRPLFAAISKDDHIVKGHQSGHQSPERAAYRLVIHRRAIDQRRQNLKKFLEIDAHLILPCSKVYSFHRTGGVEIPLLGYIPARLPKTRLTVNDGGKKRQDNR